MLLSRQPLPRGPPGRRADERGRARDPLRRRLRGGRARAAAARARRRATRWPPLLPREASLANPIDMLGSAVGSTYEAVLPHVLADPGIDAVIVLFVPPVVAGAEEVAEAVVRGVRAAPRHATSPCWPRSSPPRGSPRACSSPTPASPTFDYPESAARALGHAADRAEWLRRPAGDVARARRHRPARRGGARRVGARRPRTTPGSTAPQVRELLEAYGIPLVPERVAATADGGGRRRAASSGCPVVVKTRRAGRAQDRDRRDRARPRRPRRTSGPRSSGSGCRCSSSR